MKQNTNFNFQVPYRQELRIKASKLGPTSRDKWINSESSKMNKLKCKDHQFCSLKYEFLESKQDQLSIEEDRVRSASCKKYSKSRSRNPNANSLIDSTTINLSALSEEALDDWILQSINRPLSQALDNKKKFEMPQSYQDELKSRYSYQRNNKLLMENKEYYFSELPQKSQKYIIIDGKSVLNPMNLLFDHNNLEPKVIWPGIPIALREEQKIKKQKIVELRRGGIYLKFDENYKRLLKTQFSSRNVKRLTVHQISLPKSQEDVESHLFLQNFDNFTRNQSNKMEVLTSFAEKELKEINEQIKNQQKVQESENQFILHQDESGNTLQDQMKSDFDSQSQYYQQQHTAFKREMNGIVSDFQSFMKQQRNEQQESNITQENKYLPQQELETQSQQQQQQNQINEKIRRSSTVELPPQDNNVLSPSILAFIQQSNINKYKYQEKPVYHNQNLKERLKKSIEKQVENKKYNYEHEQSSNFDNDSIIQRTQYEGYQRKLMYSQHSQQKKAISSFNMQIQLRSVSRKSNRPSTQGSHQKNATSMAHQMLQWYQSDENQQQQQQLQEGKSTKQYSRSANGRRRTNDSIQLKSEKKTTDMLNINSLIVKMNQDRSVEFDPKLLETDQQILEAIIKKPTETPLNKSKILKQFDEIIDNSYSKQQSRLLTTSNKFSVNSRRLLNVNLQMKTQKLLNSNSEDKIKYKPELIGFNSQLTPIDKQFTNQTLSNSEFWFNKGVLALKTDVNTSLYCFKQSLIENPLQFESIQNISIIYEQLGKYSTSQKWFQLALSYRKTNQLKFGLAICLYKMGQFATAIQILDDIILEEQNALYIYLRGICAKRMFDLERAALNYKIVKQKSRAINYELCVDFMMAVIFSQTRQLEIKFNPFVFCQFHKLVTQIIEQEYYVEILVPFWNNSKQQWIKEEGLLAKLNKLSFFKRMATSILRSFLKEMVLKVVESDSVIFPKENEVHIVVAGNINVYDHRGVYSRPEIVANYKEGDILGCPDKDNGLCNISDIWFLTQTQIEYISIDKRYFEELWQAQVQSNGVEMLTRLEKLPIFKGVSTLTLYKLVYELLEKIEVKKNTVLFNDCSYYENFEYIHLRKSAKLNIGKRLANIVLKHNTYQCKFQKLFLKHKLNINKLKYNRMHLDGFYIILKGECELENPNGFNSFYLNYGEYFGETLMFNTKSYNSFGRIRVSEDDTIVLKLSRFDFNKIPTLDIKIMEANCLARKEINDLDQIYQNRMKVQKMKRNRAQENILAFD